MTHESRLACISYQLLSVIQILEIYSQEMCKTAGICNSQLFFLISEFTEDIGKVEVSTKYGLWCENAFYSAGGLSKKSFSTLEL